MMGRYRKIKRHIGLGAMRLELDALRRPGAPLPWEVFLRALPADGTRRWMVRAGGTLAEAPGRRGYWKTRAGTLHAHTLRIGSPISQHGLTLGLHWRRPARA